MLSRVANNLYWLGRYVERTEHLARYTKIQYFSSLDAPLSLTKEFVLESILRMSGSKYDPENINEPEALFTVALDKDNPASIISSISYGRENARGTRELISTELWENINKYYHFVKDYPVDTYKTTGLYDFTQNCLINCSVIKGSIDNTLLHDSAWALINLGMHLERSIQIARILINKVNDLNNFSKNDAQPSNSFEIYQWTSLLQLAEGFDMSRRYYKAAPNRRNTLEFLILNTEFPRSISSSLIEARNFINKISERKNYEAGTMEFMIAKVVANIRFQTIEEIDNDILTFLNESLNELTLVTQALETKYFSY